MHNADRNVSAVRSTEYTQTRSGLGGQRTTSNPWPLWKPWKLFSKVRRPGEGNGAWTKRAKSTKKRAGLGVKAPGARRGFLFLHRQTGQRPQKPKGGQSLLGSHEGFSHGRWWAVEKGAWVHAAPVFFHFSRLSFLPIALFIIFPFRLRAEAETATGLVCLFWGHADDEMTR